MVIVPHCLFFFSDWEWISFDRFTIDHQIAIIAGSEDTRIQELIHRTSFYSPDVSMKAMGS